MPSTTQTETADGRDDRQLETDSLAGGVSLMLVLTILQRMVGFGRNLIFCRMLDPAELGRWNLAFSLLILAAPLLVLGLPGSFGRYVEYYRQRGQLRQFLRRTSISTIVLAAIGIISLLLAKRTAAWMFFGDPDQVQLLVVSVVCLASVIAFNFLSELFTALRRVRIVSYMQLSNGLLFAVFALGLTCFYQASAVSIVIGYALACLISSLFVVWPLWNVWSTINDDEASISQGQLWSKLVPFAAWIWFADLLGNLFGAADRYMIVHFSNTDVTTASAIVGQYHSSLVIPMLILSVAYMLASIVLPYLSHDWEKGKKDEVSGQMNTALKLFGFLSVGGGVCVLLLSPIIFGWALDGKYDDGLAVLPLTLTFVCWAGLGVIAGRFLWCVERAGMSTVGPFIGLGANVGLNFVLLPKLGLLGAVIATATGNLVTLAICVALCCRYEFKIDRGTIVICALPFCLPLGAYPATFIMLACLWVALRTNWLFRLDEQLKAKAFLQEKLSAVTARWSLSGRPA